MKNKYTTVQVSKELRNRIKEEAKTQRRSISAVVEIMAEDYLKRKYPSKPTNILKVK